jgi:hypothetical protein
VSFEIANGAENHILQALQFKTDGFLSQIPRWGKQLKLKLILFRRSVSQFFLLSVQLWGA